MPNYQNSKIYKVWSVEGPEIYIGSTTQPLHTRLSKHKTISSKCMSKVLFEKYNDVRIELIELFPCENKIQLNAREGFHMRLNLEFLVNKYIAGRTRKESIKVSNKKWRDANKDKTKARNKAYRIAHKKKINETFTGTTTEIPVNI